jgi:hypothetical protein
LKRGRQGWRCNLCLYRWTISGNHKRDYRRYYREWLFGRRTLNDISSALEISLPKLQKEFDRVEVTPAIKPAPSSAINLMIDATFFGREYGYLCFHDGKSIIYFFEIKTESVKHLRNGLKALQEAGYRFKSFTIDGRKGYLQNIRKMFGNVPVQMCLFHQKAIIRRYITDRPRSDCGKELKALMQTLCNAEPQNFIDRFFALQRKYETFLLTRNQKKEYRHGALRSAFRSLETNLPHLFIYKEIPDANITPTINHLEAAFSHLKEKIKIHRGLRKNRKKKAASFILSSPPLF